MKVLIAIRIAIVFVLCVVVWYLAPWPIALLLTILAALQEFHALTMRRLLCLVATVQNMHRNTSAGGSDVGRTKTG